MPAISPDLLSGLIGFVLTIFVLSYLFGDQLLFRLAIYIFVGVSAGYVVSVIWHQVLAPQLFHPLIFGTMQARLLSAVPLFLALLLFAKAIPSIAKVGTPSVAFIVGVGAAVAVAGALTGTLFPQALGAIRSFDLKAASEQGIPAGVQLLEGALTLGGTIGTLAYFQFTARRGDDGKYRQNPITRTLALIGKAFVAITFGFLFAGVYSAALTALIERLDFLIGFVTNLWLR